MGGFVDELDTGTSRGVCPVDDSESLGDLEVEVRLILIDNLERLIASSLSNRVGRLVHPALEVPLNLADNAVFVFDSNPYLTHCYSETSLPKIATCVSYTVGDSSS